MQGIYCKASELAVTDVEVAETAAIFLARDICKHSGLFYHSYNR